MDVSCVSLFLPEKKATKLNMTQCLLSCCCYCFANAWLGEKKSLWQSGITSVKNVIEAFIKRRFSFPFIPSLKC